MQLMIANIFMYFLLLTGLYIKNKNIDLKYILLSWYGFIALCGWYAVYSNVYFMIYHLDLPNDGFDAYIYVIVLFLILVNPLKYVELNDSYSKGCGKYNMIPQPFYLIALIVFAIFGLMKIYEAVNIIGIDMADIYTELHEDGKAVISYNNPILIKISTSGYMLYVGLYPFVFYHTIIAIINRRLKYFAGIILLLLIILPQFLVSIVGASRGGLVFSLFNMLFFVYLFRKALGRKILRCIFLFFGLLVIGVFFVLFFITSERVGGEAEYIFNGATLYLGEAFPNVICRYWDQVAYHPFGERLFGLNTYGSLDNYFSYWDVKTKVTMATFKTLPMDVYIEFGKLGGFLFVIIIAFIFGKIINKQGVKLWNVGLAFWYYQLCVSAVFSYNKRGEVNFKILLFVIVLTIIFYRRQLKSIAI